MNETVYVEFLFYHGDAGIVPGFIHNLGEEFELIESDSGHMEEDDHGPLEYWKVTGKINASTATAMKLGNTFPGAAMRVSYISAELKDKYRS